MPGCCFGWYRLARSIEGSKQSCLLGPVAVLALRPVNVLFSCPHMRLTPCVSKQGAMVFLCMLSCSREGAAFSGRLTVVQF